MIDQGCVHVLANTRLTRRVTFFFMCLTLIQESGKSVLKVWFQFSIRDSFIIMPLRHHYHELPSIFLFSLREYPFTTSWSWRPECWGSDKTGHHYKWLGEPLLCLVFLLFNLPEAYCWAFSENSPWLDGYHVYKRLFRKLLVPCQVPSC